MARTTEIRPGTYARIGHMDGWYEKTAEGVWLTDWHWDDAAAAMTRRIERPDPDRYDAAAIQGHGLYIDLMGKGRADLMGVYQSSDGAAAALAKYNSTGKVP